MARKNIRKTAQLVPATKEFRADGWANVLTGLGVRGKDKRMSAEVQWERMDRNTSDHLYAADNMARKIVDLLPDDAFREGFKITGLDEKTGQNLMQAFEKMGGVARFNKAWKMARQYGGAGMFLITDDLQKLSDPLSQTARLVGFNVLHRWELFANSTDMNLNILSSDYLKPVKYTYQPHLSNANDSIGFKKIHASRILRFDGLYLPEQLFATNQFWGDSILNALKNAIANYQTSNDSAASVLQDFRVAILKIKNLADKIGADDDQPIMNRLEMVNLCRSIAKMVVIDADGEDFDYKISAVTGVKDLIDKVENKLVAETNVPRTVLLGESPSGLGATGNHEQDNWYDFVANQQQIYLKPKLMQVLRMLAMSMGINAVGMDIEFNPLYQLTDKEQADLRKVVAETDQIYITQGVVDPNEVALSRFGSPKYSTETTIDVELRKELPISIGQPEPDPTNPHDPSKKPVPGQDPAKNQPIQGQKPAPFKKFDGGPGSGGGETAEIIMPQSKYISVGTRKGLLQNVESTPQEIEMNSITHVGQEKYVPSKLKAMVENWDDVKFKPIAVLKVGDEHHVIDGHHRYLAAKKMGEKTLNAEVYVRSRKDGADGIKPAKKK